MVNQLTRHFLPILTFAIGLLFLSENLPAQQAPCLFDSLYPPQRLEFGFGEMKQSSGAAPQPFCGSESWRRGCIFFGWKAKAGREW
ncbi:MAG: hypothetical protein R2830_26250 [Saprospiraceae bacterium]